MIRTIEELRGYVSLDIPELRGMGEDYRANIAAVQGKLSTITGQLKGLTFRDPQRRLLLAERYKLLRELTRLQTAQRQEEERIRREKEEARKAAAAQRVAAHRAKLQRRLMALNAKIKPILRVLDPLRVQAAAIKRKLRKLGRTGALGDIGLTPEQKRKMVEMLRRQESRWRRRPRRPRVYTGTRELVVGKGLHARPAETPLVVETPSEIATREKRQRMVEIVRRQERGRGPISRETWRRARARSRELVTGKIRR